MGEDMAEQLGQNQLDGQGASTPTTAAANDQGIAQAATTAAPRRAASGRRSPRSSAAPDASEPPAQADVAPSEVASDTASETLSETLSEGRRRERRTTGGPAPAPDATAGGTTRARRSGPHARESGVLGLGERARTTLDRRALTPLLDPLQSALPAIRHTLLNTPLEEGLRALVQTLATTLAPAAVQCWLTDPAAWTNESGRVGGAELSPSLRLRAAALGGASPASSGAIGAPAPPAPAPGAAPGGNATPMQAAQSYPQSYPLAGGAGVSSPNLMMITGASLPRLPIPIDPLIAEVVASRRPVTLFDADNHPLAGAWVARLPEAPTPPSILFSALATPPPPATLGSLVAYPLRARGQFLGVVALGARARLTHRQLAAIEEICELVALATDRDRLLSYSRSQEALAQTVVRQAPVAMAVLTGADHIFALANPTFASLLGLHGEANLIGRRLEEVTPEHARSLVASLRLDAVYAGGEPQAMFELPIHQEQGLTYWNITS